MNSFFLKKNRDFKFLVVVHLKFPELHQLHQNRLQKEQGYLNLGKIRKVFSIELYLHRELVLIDLSIKNLKKAEIRCQQVNHLEILLLFLTKVSLFQPNFKKKKFVYLLNNSDWDLLLFVVLSTFPIFKTSRTI